MDITIYCYFYIDIIVPITGSQSTAIYFTFTHLPEAIFFTAYLR